MIAVWRARGGDVEALTLDALDALAQRDDLTVRMVPEYVPADAQHGCSVTGGYLDASKTLIVTESMSVRRQHFTVLHELGHHLQQNDLSLGEKIIAHRDEQGFEEAACDAFAARILIPDDMIRNAIDGNAPTARTAAELFEQSNASRAAIAVRLVNLLKPAAVVAVFDESGTVSFATARGLYPPRRLSDQSENPLVRRMIERPDLTDALSRDDAFIHYSNGGTSNKLYGHATWVGDRIITIMVEEAAPWLLFSPPRDGTATYVAREDDELAERRTKYCQECFLEKHPAQFDAGSDACNECAG